MLCILVHVYVSVYTWSMSDLYLTVCVCVSVCLSVCRYIGEIGDLVVGRISSVEAKRWKCDVSSQKVSGLA